MSSTVSCDGAATHTNPGTALAAQDGSSGQSDSAVKSNGNQLGTDGSVQSDSPQEEPDSSRGPGNDDGRTDGADGSSPSDSAPGDDGGSDAQEASITVGGATAGQPCESSSDCASGLCVAAICVDAKSCLDLLDASPGIADREYEIDPDGPGMGLAPFVVYCDMTTDGGGWTTLPLRFADSNYWSITQAGYACVVIDIQDDAGDFRQYQSSNVNALSYTYMEFVPPIPASSVRFVAFDHINGGTSNTMDFLVGTLPSASTPQFEGWYFADPAAPDAPVGYAFPDAASCTPPYQLDFANTVCSRDVLTTQADPPAAPFPFTETVPLGSQVTHFEMGLIEGCFSTPVDPVLLTGEQFRIANPPAADGVWVTGIAVR